MTWLLLTITLVALFALGCSFWFSRAKTQPAKSQSFIPDPQNDKVVLVKGWDENELRKIIAGFISTYEYDGYPPYSIESQKRRELVFRLHFPKDIHPLLFTFLINYIAYPFELDLSNRSILVAGRTTLTQGFDSVDASLIGQKALLYLPDNDQDHDVVYMSTESGSILANSFSDLTWRHIGEARLSPEIEGLMRDE